MFPTCKVVRLNLVDLRPTERQRPKLDQVDKSVRGYLEGERVGHGRQEQPFVVQGVVRQRKRRQGGGEGTRWYGDQVISFQAEVLELLKVDKRFGFDRAYPAEFQQQLLETRIANESTTYCMRLIKLYAMPKKKKKNENDESL